MQSNRTFRTGVTPKTVFVPGIRLMNRLRYQHKFLLVGVIFFIPIVVLMLQLLNNLNQDARFADDERKGLLMMQPMDRLLPSLGHYRNSLVQPADQGGKEAAKQQIDAALSELERLTQAYDREVGASDELAAAAAHWKALQTLAPGNAAFAERQLQLEQSMMQLIDEIKNNSNLILDPELDTYYLMDSTINLLPSLWLQLSQAAALGLQAQQHGGFGAEAEREEALRLAYDISRSHQAVLKAAQTVAEYNPNFLPIAQKELDDSSRATNDWNVWMQQRLLNSGASFGTPDELLPLYDKALASSTALYEKETGLLMKRLEERIRRLESEKAMSMTTVILVLVFIAYLFLSFTLAIHGSIRQLGDVSALLLDGKLTARVPLQTHDELRTVMNAFNSLAASFMHMIQESGRVAGNTLSASDQLHSASAACVDSIHSITNRLQSVASGARTQVQMARETSSAMHEMAVGVQSIAESSFIVSETAGDTAAESRQGRQIVQSAIEQMASIRTSFGETSVAIRRLAHVSLQIDRMLQVIHELAAQTRLLALNASIEASRAGEHGRGFQVVAAEVRKLADGSTEAVKQVAGFVTEIKESCQVAVARMEADVVQVDKGEQVMTQVGDSFRTIMSAVDRVAEQIREVSAVSEQMSAGTQQVSASMEETLRISTESMLHVDQVAGASQDQLAAMHQISEAAGHMQQLARHLHRLLERFQVED